MAENEAPDIDGYVCIGRPALAFASYLLRALTNASIATSEVQICYHNAGDTSLRSAAKYLSVFSSFNFRGTDEVFHFSASQDG